MYTVEQLALMSTIYLPGAGENVRITRVDATGFAGYGEETMEDCYTLFSEVDLTCDLFYAIRRWDPSFLPEKG
jgi:hypothetical protein